MKPLLAASLLVAALLGAGGAPAAPRPRAHVVYPGQTLAMIAKRYNVTVAELCRANALRKCRTIQPGLRLRIPVPGEAVAPPPARPEAGAGARTAGGHPKPETGGGSPASTKGGATEPKRAPAAESPARRGEPEAAPVPVREVREGRPAARRAGGKATRKWRRGWVRLSSLMGSYEGPIFDRAGRVTPDAQRGLRRVFASWRTGARTEMHPRLLRVLVRVSDRFEGRPIRVVSGFRPYSPSQYTPHSRHNEGKAVDFSIEGLPNAAVRDYCRSLVAVGVGYYPNSSFVHLDVREASAYWVDFSGPGERPRYADARGRDPGRRERPAVSAAPVGGADSEPEAGVAPEPAATAPEHPPSESPPAAPSPGEQGSDQPPVAPPSGDPPAPLGTGKARSAAPPARPSAAR